MSDSIGIVFFVTEISDSSIPLEIAAELSNRGLSVTVCSFYSPGDHSFDVEVLSLGGDSLFSFSAYSELYRFLKRRDPDVLHVHPNATGAAARLLGRLTRVPLIVSTEHGSHDEFGWLRNAVNGGTNWLNDVVVANSEATADSLRWWERALLEASGADLEVIHNGVDTDRVRRGVGKVPPNIPSGPLLGTVGRLVPVKNQARLIRAAAPLLRDGEASLLVVGRGPERKTLEDVAASEDVTDDVLFLGHLSRDVVYAVLHELDVFAFPSKAEGFGVAVVEAMAAGVAPVVSDIPALREVVGEAGEYVDPHDTEDIERVIRRLLVDVTRRRTLAQRARERAELFTLTKTVERYSDLYDRHLQDPPFNPSGPVE